jgi:hypothetical protein
MKLWKWILVDPSFEASNWGGRVEWKRSMSIVLPVPTEPWRYKPLGTEERGMMGAGVEGLLEKNLPN